jgi:predicted acyltransferase
MTIALMILVNIPGSWSYLYPPLQHADWNGCTPTDLVFPFFLFIVGAAMAFSFSKYNYKLNAESFLKVVERTFLIFFVGLMLNYYPFFKGDLSNQSLIFNILDVIKKLVLSLIPFFLFLWILKKLFWGIKYYSTSSLSTIAKTLFYFGISILFIILLFFLPKLLNLIPFYNKDVSHLRILGVLQRIALAYGFASLVVLLFKRKYIPIVASLLLIIYWWLLWYFGGEAPFSLETNIVRDIDLNILGSNHIWHGKGIPFDPEGLLSTLPSIATPLIGYLIGRYIKDNKEKFGKWFYMMIGFGIVLIITGKIWNIFFPINKSLWTSSYVLYTSGLAILFLSLFYWFGHF